MENRSRTRKKFVSPIKTSKCLNLSDFKVVEPFFHQGDALALKSPAIKRKLGIQEATPERSYSVFIKKLLSWS